MQERDRHTSGHDARQPREQGGGARDDATRPPEVNEEQVEALSQKKEDRDRRRPDDEPGAEGERTARADEDTYD